MANLLSSFLNGSSTLTYNNGTNVIPSYTLVQPTFSNTSTGASIFNQTFGSSSSFGNSLLFGSSLGGSTLTGSFGNSFNVGGFNTSFNYGSLGNGFGFGTIARTSTTTTTTTGTTIATKQVSEDATATADLLTFASTDFEYSNGDDVFGLQITDLPDSGTLKLNGVDVVYSQLIPEADFIGLTYTPDADYNGTDSFAVKLSTDGVTYDSTNSIVSIVVLPTSDAPTITAVPAVVVTEGTTDSDIGDTLMNTFADIDGDTIASITITAVPQYGTLQYTTATGVVVPIIAGMDITAADAANLVYVAPTSGNVSTTTAMTIGYTVTDDTGEVSSAGSLALTLVDGNDAPEFQTVSAVSLPENDITESVTPVTAVDSNDTSDTISYSIATSSTDGALFTIDSSSGELRFRQQQDFENPGDSGGDGIYELTLIATDSGSPARTDTENVTITLTNVDDEAPVFTTVPASAITITSEDTGTVTTLTASDSGAGTTVNTSAGTPLSFEIISGDANSAFGVTNIGAITVADPTELKASGAPTSYTLTVQVEDAEENASTTAITIYVDDETAPEISAPTSAIEVAETTSTGSVVYTVDASDNVAVTSYAFPDNAPLTVTDNFSINTSNGQISYIGDIDAETNSGGLTVNVPVVVSDAAGEETSATIDLKIVDADDEVPAPTNTATVFTEGSVVSSISSSMSALTVTIEEDADGTVLTFAFGDGEYDATANGDVTYALASSSPTAFSIETDTGILSVDGSLDFETAETHTVTVVVTDASGETAETALAVNVTDVDEAPTIMEEAMFDALSEGTSVTLTLSEVLGIVGYTDPENDAATAVSVVSQPITENGALVGQITHGSSLLIDFSSNTHENFAGPVTFEIEIKNGSGANTESGTATIAMFVEDMPDAPNLLINGSDSNIDFSSTILPLPSTAPTGGLKLVKLSADDVDLDEQFLDTDFTIEVGTLQNNLDSSDFHVDDGWLEYVGSYTQSSSNTYTDFTVSVEVIDQFNYADSENLTFAYI